MNISSFCKISLSIVLLQHQAGIGVAVVVIVCIGFVSLLVVLGVMRIRNARRHSRDVNVEEKQEMEWDNSALTITVNPMDQEVGLN